MKKIILALVVFGFALSGCSSTTNSSDTLTYSTEKGDISYSASPVIYTDYYVGELLYLDANVVGADMTYPAESWSTVAQERGVENISGDMEAIAALTPDLIITIHEDYYDQYSAIAPTIYIPYGTYDPEELVVELGKIVGAEDKANQWVEEFNASIDSIKELINYPDAAISIVDNWGDATYMYGENYGRGGYILYNKLGLHGNDLAESEYIRLPESYLTVDAESIVNYVGDVMFIADSGESVKNIEALPTYDTLEPVQNDKVVLLDNDIFLYNDPYSLDNQVEALKGIYESEEL